MQYDVTTPAEYLKTLQDDWRKDTLLALRSHILNNGTGLKEVIAYKMLGYSDERGAPFHLNAQKNYVSLYIGDAKKIDPEGVLLAGIDVGKGCIRFKKSTKVQDTRIDEFIAKAIEQWNRGVDIGC